jgi:hypothetical protein
LHRLGSGPSINNTHESREARQERAYLGSPMHRIMLGGGSTDLWTNDDVGQQGRSFVSPHQNRKGVMIVGRMSSKGR